MVDIRERLPFRLSFRVKSSATSYTDLYNAYDVAIGGIPFLLKVTPDTPLVRQTAPFRKEQLDTSAEPGEQTLTGWWLRSQSSFHWGAGLKFGDPELDDSAPFRFHSSEGVNVFTEGQVTLLPKTTLIKAASGSVKMVAGVYSGTDVYYRVEGSDVFRGTADGTESLVLDGSATITDIATDGDDVYVATLSGIYKIDHGSGIPTLAWNVTATNHVSLGWVKQRIVTGIDNKIYVPTFGTPTLPTAIYSHPNEDWIWNDIDEGPTSIYVSGYVGSESCIVRLGLDNTGAVPTLTNATVVGNVPTGELIKCIKSYLGAFLAIGTSRGVRIADILSDGRLSTGPLIETPSSVEAVSARGNSFLCAYSDSLSDGTSGLLQVNLSTKLSSGKYPYATDLRAHVAGTVDSVCLLGLSDRIIFGVANHGVYIEHLTDLETQGFLQTAAIRYNTVWPKLFKRFNVRGSFPGSLTVSTIDDVDTETTIVSVSESTSLTEDLAINYPDSPQGFISLKFTLNRDIDDATQGSLLHSYQVKAIPGGPRPRLISLPLLCADYERDGDEKPRGHRGFAMERLNDLEALDSAGDVVLYQDLKLGTSILCTIEQIEYRQIISPGRDGSRSGGILTIILRTLSS
jgi:hypothetical protein